MEVQIEHIDDYLEEKQESLTTIIVIKCIDGIVIASDSQVTAQSTKNMDHSKIYEINKFMGIGAAGDKRHIDILVDAFRQNIGQKQFESESELYQTIYNTLLEIHRIYNIERSRRLGYKVDKLFLNVVAILAAKLSDGTFYVYYIPTDLWPSAVNNYKSIGSGAILANLLLTQQNRVPKTIGKTLSDKTLENNIWTPFIPSMKLNL